MNIVNCPKCGRLFQKFSEPLCESCTKEEEALFESVRTYLNDNPNCKVEDLSKETGASAKKILKWLKEGRLEVSKGMKGTLRCESCNKPITAGRYCEACIIEISQTVNEMFSKPSGPRMHTQTDKKNR